MPSKGPSLSLMNSFFNALLKSPLVYTCTLGSANKIVQQRAAVWAHNCTRALQSIHLKLSRKKKKKIEINDKFLHVTFQLHIFFQEPVMFVSLVLFYYYMPQFKRDSKARF